ncbi:peptide chain release factor 1-like, mitochondrial [Tribolium madens]|uniref:peptide chain release factor 1-like, mitochondrial n=1 Tax=Tribolium madens TaxID=41895 RepID=UPI001CF736C6|nr:peptide chain release factor 1-like, mitochondrial [Tribolium madens]
MFLIQRVLLRKKYFTLHKWHQVFYTTSKYDLDLSIRGVSLQNYIKRLEEEYETLLKLNNYTANSRFHQLQPLINTLNERKAAVDNIQNLSELLNEKDDEIRKLAEEEKLFFEGRIKSIDDKLLDAILPSDKEDQCSSIVLEVNAGVGGQEAMLFANELFEMYCNFAEYQGWETQIADYSTIDMGGIRHASAIITGPQAFQFYKHEAGVHRVQRIPTTEKAGRIHTSTVSVVALPQPTDIEVTIDNKDLKIETKRASGAGGQHVNTTESAVRVTHLPTGLSVECQVDRSQVKNRQIALTKLRALIYQRDLEDQIARNENMRKSQVRSNFRNEKIRTYNFPQDRITDHRLQGCNVHNLKGFLQGNDALGNLIKKLDQQYKIETLLNLVNNE